MPASAPSSNAQGEAAGAVASAGMAAESAITLAEAAATLGITQARLAYTLTVQAVSEAPLAVLPLIALSGTAITEGLGAYVAVQDAAKIIDVQVKAAATQADKTVEAAYQKAVSEEKKRS